MTLEWCLFATLCAFVLGRFTVRRPSPHESVDTAAQPEDLQVEALLESMESGIVVLDDAHCIAMINGRGREMIQCLDDTVGLHLDQTELGPALIPLIKGNKEKSVELRLLHDPDRFIHARIAPSKGWDGLVFILHEITELKRLEAVRSDFVANVSHELRTPVSVIAANSETLLDGALEDKEVAREFVIAMHRNAGRISNLVSDLLDLARIEAGSVEIDSSAVGLHSVVNRTIESLSSVVTTKNISLINETDLSLQVYANPDALEQVLLNFTENAVKYGNQDGTVCIRSHQTSSHVRVEVIDDGVGIAAQHRDRLFERFYRVDKGRTLAEGGTGLGLSIVKHLVTSMGGDVGMEPNFPTGSVFWFTIPSA
jgi:two-component system phosphate regulon sensor histidine kinase PhoR